MLDFKHILVAVADPTAKNAPAVQRAAAIAKRTGAKITLFHSLYSPYVAGERAMLKVRRTRTADCVVGGFRYGQLVSHDAKCCAASTGATRCWAAHW